MTKGLTPIWVFRFSTAGGVGDPRSHAEYSRDDDGRWWGRVFQWQYLGYRWVASAVPPGWAMLDEGWELPPEARLARGRMARLPRAGLVELRAEADRMLAECLERRTT